MSLFKRLFSFSQKGEEKPGEQKILRGSGGRTREDVDEIIREGHRKIGDIFRASERIKNEELSEKIRAICISARRIYDNIDKYPHDIRAARQFLLYYIDTTAKVINKYAELSKNRNHIKDADNILEKTENVIGIIEKAFDKQLSKLYEDDLFDLQVEIQVLEKTIQFEGLGE
ncbi:MAG: hypothetical protein GY754_18260 [bacterium]|nr:hypothetical protein [bacterium]